MASSSSAVEDASTRRAGQKPRAHGVLELLAQVRAALLERGGPRPRPSSGRPRSRARSSATPWSSEATVLTIAGTWPSWAASESIDSISATTRSTPSRSALFTTNTSAISMIPAFRAWTSSPEAGHEHHDAHVGGAHDLHLVLPHPHGLHEDHVLPGRGEHGDDVAGGGGEPAQMAARGHRADEDPGVEGVGLHADAVAEDRAPAVGRRGIDGHDPHGLPLLARRCAVRRSTSVDLPAPGGPVTPTTRARPAWGKSAASSRGRLGPTVLHQADGPRHRAHVAAQDRGGEVR